MDDLAACWPPYALTVTTADLTLTVARESDVPELVELVLSGVHDPAMMPFDEPWTDADPAELPQNYLRYQSSVKAGFTPDSFTLEMVVRRDGEVVGCQGLSARQYPVTRSLETGSWLGRRFHGQGIGTRMRQAVCALAFDVLGARQVTSSAFVDNPASLAVSRKVGYVENGTQLKVRRGEAALNQRLLLTPERLVRGAPVEVTGAGPLLRMLGLSEPATIG
ncbi:GNAT family N-acetyltransferase [Auraticoccus sp. F435]|uniref:GNAT family N-acetyltransferase n=1 Tax=Auraticoccus cholistanensis TaxID=2656650 RepID=A0A6A9V0I9_9ACTN|nr:GNAT family protein [Auraticoccus cholistanensis]MVA75689.1 GNAT family N-acetyltransferase [Auraticoccus cholistanensis]